MPKCSPSSWTPLTLKEAGEVLTPAETMQLLKLGRNKTYALITAGTIRSLRFGRRILVPKRAIEELLAASGTSSTLAEPGEAIE